MIVRRVLDWSVGFDSVDVEMAEQIRSLTAALTPSEGEPDVVYRMSRRPDGTISLERDDWYWWLEPASVFPEIMADLVDLLRDRTDEILLHSAALARDGRALLLPGMSGRGKSSTTVALAARGFRIMSDELALLDSTGRVSASPLPLKIRASALSLVEADDDLRVAGPRFFAKDEWTYPVVPRHPGPPRAPLALVCFLRPREGGTRACVELVSPGRATFDLLAESISRTPPSEEQLKRVSALCETIPARAVFPGSIDDTADAVCRIWETLTDDH